MKTLTNHTEVRSRTRSGRSQRGASRAAGTVGGAAGGGLIAYTLREADHAETLDTTERRRAVAPQQPGLEKRPAAVTTLQTSVLIPHPPARVWAVLAAGQEWHLWNPSQPGLRGALETDSAGRIALRLARWTLWVPITYQRVEPCRALFWQGGIPGIFTAVHGFELHPDGAGTLVVHIERFSGIIPAALGRLLGRILAPMYQATNDGLLARTAAVTEER